MTINGSVCTGVTFSTTQAGRATGEWDCSESGGGGGGPLNITYATTELTTGQASQTLLPTVTGGDGPRTFSIDGILPVGVTFNPATGALTGPASWAAGPTVVPGDGYSWVSKVISAGGGDIIAVGGFNGTAVFGATSLTSDGDDGYIARLNSDGVWQWALALTGAGEDEIVDVVAAADGSPIILAKAGANFTFEGENGSQGALLAKISPAGLISWAAQPSSGAENMRLLNPGYALAAAPDGGAYFTLPYSDSVTIGGDTLTSEGLEDIAVARINSAGTWQWAISGGGVDADQPERLTLASDGAPLLAVTTQGDAIFGAQTVNDPEGRNKAAYAKINASGTWNWVTAVDSWLLSTATLIVPGPSGGAVVSAAFQESADLGAAGTLNYGPGEAGYYIAALDEDGDFIWARGGMSDNAQPAALQRTGNATVFAMAYSDETTFEATTYPAAANGASLIGKLSDGGAVTWATNVENAVAGENYAAVLTGGETAFAFALAPAGATFGATTLTPESPSGTAVAAIDTNGNWTWAVSPSGTGDQYSSSLLAGSDGTLLLAGGFFGQTSLGATALTNDAAGDYNGFLAWIAQDGTFAQGVTGLPADLTITVSDDSAPAGVETTITLTAS